MDVYTVTVVDPCQNDPIMRLAFLQVIPVNQRLKLQSPLTIAFQTFFIFLDV